MRKKVTVTFINYSNEPESRTFWMQGWYLFESDCAAANVRMEGILKVEFPLIPEPHNVHDLTEE